MDTDQLIRTLAADSAYRPRPMWLALTLALVSAAPITIAIFFWRLGVRLDIMTEITIRSSISSLRSP